MKTLGTLLISLPFIVFLLIYIEGGMMGILVYLLYQFAAFLSTCSFITGWLIIKNRKFK